MKRWFIDGDDWGKEPKWDELAPGQLDLTGDNLAANVVSRMPEVLQKRGAFLGRLTLESRYMDGEASLNFTGFDWARFCPNLRYIWIKGSRLNATVFQMPCLEQAFLADCMVLAEDDVILGNEAGGPGSALQQLNVENISFAAQRFGFAKHAQLRDLSWRLEFEGRDLPMVFRIEDCALLSRIDLDILGSFELQLAGQLGELEEVRLDAGKDGQAGVDTSELESATFNLVQKIYV